jgi:hypothetical protein
VSCFSALEAGEQPGTAGATWDSLALPPAWSTSQPIATGGSASRTVHLLEQDDLILCPNNHSATTDGEGAIVPASALTAPLRRSLIGIGAVAFNPNEPNRWTIDPQRLKWVAW